MLLRLDDGERSVDALVHQNRELEIWNVGVSYPKLHYSDDFINRKGISDIAFTKEVNANQYIYLSSTGTIGLNLLPSGRYQAIRQQRFNFSGNYNIIVSGITSLTGGTAFTVNSLSPTNCSVYGLESVLDAGESQPQATVLFTDRFGNPTDYAGQTLTYQSGTATGTIPLTSSPLGKGIYIMPPTVYTLEGDYSLTASGITVAKTSGNIFKVAIQDNCGIEPIVVALVNDVPHHDKQTQAQINTATVPTHDENIPVVFHILENNDDVVISDDEVRTYIASMNELQRSSDAQHLFRLALTDAVAKPAYGIERMKLKTKMAFDGEGKNPPFSEDTRPKSLLKAWNPHAYLNVWIVPLSSQSTKMYSQISRSMSIMDGTVLDGIVIDSKEFRTMLYTPGMESKNKAFIRQNLQKYINSHRTK